MERMPFPGYRELRAGDELDTFIRRGRARFGKTRDLVMIGQRENVDAVKRGATNDIPWRQHPIGIRRMTVKVSLDHVPNSIASSGLAFKAFDVIGRA